MSLRRRLSIGLVVLVALVLAVVGVVTVQALRSSLLQQVDQQLALARGRPFRLGPDGGPEVRGQPLGTLSVVLRTDGSVASAALAVPVQSGDQPAAELTATDAQRLANLARSADSGPHTVSLSAPLGRYRALSSRLDTGVAVVTGLPLAPAEQTVRRLLLVELAVFAGALVVVGTAGSWLVRLGLRPLDRVTATAQRVAQLPLARGDTPVRERVAVTSTETEVGRLGDAVNTMLGHVDFSLAARAASEDRLRRFVADASHELRTPLASIRGYSELFRRGQIDASPELARALGRVESEADRMSDLVEDLLLLARLDQGRPLERQPVDVALLAADAVSDARAASPAHHWQLELPAEPMLVEGDEHRLHQVLANLLSNARTHTPAGTSVRVCVRGRDQQAVVEVVDSGPGIQAEMLPRVFDRFTRGDTSRSRDRGGTGLGLSIVAAVVAAHGGSVHIESGPGRTAVTVLLPRAQTPDAQLIDAAWAMDVISSGSEHRADPGAPPVN